MNPSGHTPRGPWLPALILLLAAAPHVYQVLAIRGTCFDTDDGLQTAAAINWHRTGHFAIVAPNPALSDEPAYVRPTNWPPTYSFYIFLLLSLGVPVMWSVVIWASAFLATAIVGWYRLASEILGKGVLAALVVVPISWRLSVFPGDLLCCALAPFLMIALVRIVSTDERRANNRRLLLVSVLVAAMTAVKYSAIYFIPGTFAVLAIDAIRRGLPRSLLLGRLAVLLPATAIFLLFYLPNLEVTSPLVEPGPAQTRPGDVVRTLEGEESINVERLLTLPFTTYLLDPLKLNSVIRRAVPPLASRTPIDWIWWYRLLGWSLVFFVVWLLLVFARDRRPPGNGRTWLYLFAAFGLSCAAFLIAVDLGRGDIGHVRTYRYYAPVAPLLLVMLTHAIRSLARTKTAAARVAALCGLLALVPLAGWIASQVVDAFTARKANFAQASEFLTRTAGSLRQGERAVYFGHIRTLCQVDLPVANLPIEQFWTKATAEEPVWLFLMLNRTLSSDKYRNAIDTLSTELRLSDAEWHGWELHYARLDSGWVGTTELYE